MLWIALSISAWITPYVCRAASQPDVRILDTAGNIVTIFAPFDDTNALIGSVASADLGRDGVAEILIGSGEDSDPTVSVFRQDGSFIGEFLAYDVGYRGGVNVAACDVDDDGVSEIVTGAAWNGGPHIQIFTNMGVKKYPGFFAFNETFQGGVNISCGDVTGDGIGDIVVGAGVGGGPSVKVFDPFGRIITETFIDSATKNTGAAIALGDINSDGVDEILTSTMGYSVPTVVVWKFDRATSTLIAIQSESSSSTSPALITPIGVDDDHQILFATQGYVEPTIVSTNNDRITPFSADATHAISAAFIRKSGTHSGFVVANIAPRMHDDVSEKSIRVDISQQRLTAYEYGVPMHTFLVSTAKRGFVTPLGRTTVKEKLLYHNYVWSFGVNDPNNYNVPNVKWNLRIYDHIYIHWAYWHNNFGHPMSHGCINMNAENSEWIYMWSAVGTSVNVVE